MRTDAATGCKDLSASPLSDLWILSLPQLASLRWTSSEARESVTEPVKAMVACHTLKNRTRVSKSRKSTQRHGSFSCKVALAVSSVDQESRDVCKSVLSMFEVAYVSASQKAYILYIGDPIRPW